MQCFLFSSLRRRYESVPCKKELPYFWLANFVLFRCDGSQIWQIFVAVSGSWTCAGYRWRQIRKCTVDGGPNGGGNLAVLWSAMFVSPQRTFYLINFQEVKFYDRPVHFKTFEKSAKCSLWRQLTPSQRKVLESRILVLGKQLPNLQTIHMVRICFSSLNFWLICDAITLGSTWKCQGIFAATGKLMFTEFLLEHFRCTLPAPGKNPP